MKAKKPIASAIALLILGTLILSLGVYFCFKPELYRATCRIRSNRESIVPAPTETNVNYALYFIPTEFEVIQSEPVLDKVINKLDLNIVWTLKLGRSEKVKSSQCRMILRRQMELSLIPNTNLIGLSVCNEDKTEAAKIANAIAEAFRDFRQNQRKEQNLAAIKTQEAQLKDVKEKINNLEESLAHITKRPESAPVVAVQVTHHEQSIDETEAAYRKEEQMLDKLKAMTPEDLRAAIPAVTVDEMLSHLIQERNLAETQLIALRLELEETDPDLQRAVLAVANLDSQIDDRIQDLLQGMQTRIASLKNVVESAAVKTEEIKEGITNQPNKIDNSDGHQKVRLTYELRELQHTRDVLELRLAKLPVVEGPRVEIINRAEPPPHPVFPNHSMGIILLAVATLMDGAGLRLFNRSMGRKDQSSTK